MHCPINDHCTLVMVLSNTQSLFWIWASKLLLWQRFDFAFLGQKKKTEMGMVDFSFSSQKVWNLDVSISSRIMRFVCKISLSLLETRENIFGFLFSSRNWRKCLKFLHFFGKNSRSLLEPENRSRHFSFLFSKLEMWIPYFSFSSRFDFLASRQCILNMQCAMFNMQQWAMCNVQSTMYNLENIAYVGFYRNLKNLVEFWRNLCMHALSM